MNKLNSSIIQIITFSLAIILCATPNIHAADVSNNDVLLNTLPEDCMFCFRINNFNGTLGKLDQYLAGASPVPVSLAMLVNMQLGAVVGDPMLTGIDQGGDFAIFMIPPEADQKEPIAGILIPVTNYKSFVETNPNCKEGENGIATLLAPNSPMGGFALAEVGNGKYALVVHEMEKSAMPTLQKALANKSKLSKRLGTTQAKGAATTPVWAYVNLAEIYKKYNKDALTALEAAQQEMKQDIQSAPPEIAGMMGIMDLYFKMLPEILEKFGSGLESASIALTPEPTVLTLDLALQAKDGSELADAFIKNPKASESYKMSGYLNDNHAVNCLMKMNIPAAKKIYDMTFEIIDNTAEDSKLKEQIAEFKKSLDKTYDAMGDEVAFSFSYAGGPPPFKFQEIVEIKEPDIMREYMQNAMGFGDEIYKSMGIPAELKYEPAVSTYKNATIDILSISSTKSDDPNMVMVQKGMDKIYGGSLKYYMTQTPDKFYMVMGPNGEETLKTLIDQPASVTTPSGDIKIAIDTLENTPYNDLVCSINIIKLMKGVGEMMQTMNQSGMNTEAGMFSGLKDVQTQSCLVAGGAVSDNGAAVRIALPKQHLVEVISAVMQIQQQAMAARTPNPQPNTAPMETSGTSENMASPAQTISNQPMQSWIGKPAPELKMVDLEGKTHRVSQLKGKKIILDFWATWCPPCRKTIPDLNKLAGNVNSDLVILGLSNEPTSKLAPFAKKAKINYPVITYNDKDISAPYNQVTAIPTLFLIDSEGIIRDVLTGYHEPEELQSRLKKIN